MSVLAKRLRTWQGLSGVALLKAVLSKPALKVAVSSSFGTESAVLLDMVANISPAVPVVFVDTGKLFAETHAYRETLTRHLGLMDVRVAKSTSALAANVDPDGTLFETDPDACCHARKVMPYALAVSGFDVLITGRKRYHGDGRTNLALVETTHTHVRVNPLALFGARDIETALSERNLPRHPLAGAGYLSIGCKPCTHKSCASKGMRSGRWSDHEKTECGIHLQNHFKLQSLGG